MPFVKRLMNLYSVLVYDNLKWTWVSFRTTLAATAKHGFWMTHIWPTQVEPRSEKLARLRRWPHWSAPRQSPSIAHESWLSYGVRRWFDNDWIWVLLQNLLKNIAHNSEQPHKDMWNLFCKIVVQLRPTFTVYPWFHMIRWRPAENMRCNLWKKKVMSGETWDAMSGEQTNSNTLQVPKFNKHYYIVYSANLTCSKNR